MLQHRNLETLGVKLAQGLIQINVEVTAVEAFKLEADPDLLALGVTSLEVNHDAEVPEYHHAQQKGSGMFDQAYLYLAILVSKG